MRVSSSCDYLMPQTFYSSHRDLLIGPCDRCTISLAMRCVHHHVGPSDLCIYFKFTNKSVCTWYQ